MQPGTTPTSEAAGLSAEQWGRFEEDGYLRLGRLLDDRALEGLGRRLDDVMLGRAAIDYGRLLMQLDGSPEQTTGFKGPTLSYRKIQGLEEEPAFRAYLQQDLFRAICRRVYGPGAVACFRAMVMNKPARGGTFLGWHQDRWSYLDRDPLVTVWTALDPSTAESGAVRIVPGSHHHGVINPDDTSGFLSRRQMSTYCRSEDQVVLEADRGEAVLLHNWLLHASEVNAGDTPRRAFSVCYLDAGTRRTDGGPPYPVVFPASQP